MKCGLFARKGCKRIERESGFLVMPGMTFKSSFSYLSSNTLPSFLSIANSGCTADRGIPWKLLRFYKVASTHVVLQVISCCYDHLLSNDSLCTGGGSTYYFYVIFIITWLCASDGKSEAASLPAVDLTVPHYERRKSRRCHKMLSGPWPTDNSEWAISNRKKGCGEEVSKLVKK